MATVIITAIMGSRTREKPLKAYEEIVALVVIVLIEDIWRA